MSGDAFRGSVNRGVCKDASVRLGLLEWEGIERRLEVHQAIEDQARHVVRIYEGLRVDENDGEFALWSEDELVQALHKLGDVLHEADRG